jgi:hypothetical protein
MIRRIFVLLALCALALGPVLSQAASGGAAAPGAPLPATAEELTPNPFTPGERLITLTGGLQIPLLITPKADGANPDPTLKLGGVFGFSYQQFIVPGLALGGGLSGAWSGTIAGRTLFVAPLAFKAAYWTAAMPFEFFGALDLGALLMRFDGMGMLSPFAKLGGGGLWRLPSGWSLGLQANLWFVPEIHGAEYADLTRLGLFLETGLVAAFHL